MIPVRLHSSNSLSTAQVLELERELTAFSTLHDVAKWGFACTPMREVIDIVVQDEYTHDVIVDGPHGTYLCFDTT